MEAKVSTVILASVLALRRRDRLKWVVRRPRRPHFRLLLFKQIELCIRLQIDLVLLVELHLEADSISNGLEQAGVQERLELGTQCALKQAQNGFGCCKLLALCQSLHRTANQDELLLEVVEADDAVNLVPIVDACFKRGICGQLQVDTFVKQDIEKLEEELAIRERLRKAGNRRHLILFKDHVDDLYDLFGLLAICHFLGVSRSSAALRIFRCHAYI